MPCGDYSPSEQIAEAYEESRKATRAACDMARLIRKKDKQMPKGHKGIRMFDRLTKETRHWVRAHDKADKERIEEEKQRRIESKLRSDALAKLSPAERKALRGMVL